MKDKRITTSKILLLFVAVCFFIGVIEGGIIVWYNPELLGDWLIFIGAVAGTAFGFYSWKAKAENVQKMSEEVRNCLDKIQN